VTSAHVINRTSIWEAAHVAALKTWPDQAIPRVIRGDVRPVIDGLDLWDMWPLQLVDGSTALFDGWTLWMVLSAPVLPDPDLRHGIARIRLIAQKGAQWRDCGPALPDGLNPGGREWAGSALYDPATACVTLFYTVAGRPGETSPSYEQRLFQTRGTLIIDDGAAQIINWSAPVESFVSDDHHYMRVDQATGLPGFIKGFRDPAHFRDPATGTDYLLFTGSLKQTQSDWNGVIGIARADDHDHQHWTLLPPLVSADGLNNEQERPHIIAANGLYYLFWSTQRKVFAPGGPSGPNGLYAMVAHDVLGPYVPVNGTGLVAGNPPAEPFQTYSWWVTSDLEVAGFVDLWGLEMQKPVDDPAWRRAHFGGVPAPMFRIALDGEQARVA
jgi:levansucrase